MQNHKIEKINTSGFRKLGLLELEMKPFMVLIGTNGVGKTSFLDSLSLLSMSASGGLNKTISQMGGIANILTREKNQNLTLSVDMRVPNHNPLEYHLCIGPDRTGGRA